jgi:hypothetical protein
MSKDPARPAQVFSLLEYAVAKAGRGRPATPALGGLSGRQALELYIAAYITDQERARLILRCMTDEQVAEALSVLESQRTASAASYQ